MPPRAVPPADSEEAVPAAGPSWARVVEAIGPKVRALRQERGMTLQQLAHAADVSAAAVHKVERGDMVPTVTTMLKIASALDVPVRHFVENAEPGAPLAVHARGAQCPPRTTGSTPISGPAERFRAGATIHRLAGGTQRKGRRRAGEVLLVVLDGALDVTVADERYEVAEGESLHFPTHVPHAWSALGSGLAQYLTVTVEGGEP